MNGDSLVVRMPDGSSNKIFLASIRSPRFVKLMNQMYHFFDRGRVLFVKYFLYFATNCCETVSSFR